MPNSQDAFPYDPTEWKDSNGNGIGDNAEAAAAAAKQAPEAPVLASPVNDAVVNALAVLKTGAFLTPMPGTTHAKTHWQVFRDEDNACMLDINSTTALTSLTLPKLVPMKEPHTSGGPSSSTRKGRPRRGQITSISPPKRPIPTGTPTASPMPRKWGRKRTWIGMA